MSFTLKVLLLIAPVDAYAQQCGDAHACTAEESLLAVEHGSALFQKGFINELTVLHSDGNGHNSGPSSIQGVHENAEEHMDDDNELPLTQEGFATMQSECCLLSFDLFTRRLLLELNFEICDEGCHNGFFPFFYCGSSPSLQNFTEHIFKKSEELCACYKPVGYCSPGGLPQKCVEESTGTYDPSAHRRRVCAVTTTEAITTPAPPVTSIEITTTTALPMTTTEAMMTTEATTTPAPPVTTTAEPTTPAPPATTTEATTTPAPPVTTTEATTTPAPPVTTTKATTTPEPPVTTTKATTTPAPPVTTTKATTTPAPPVTTTEDATAVCPGPATDYSSAGWKWDGECHADSDGNGVHVLMVSGNNPVECAKACEAEATGTGCCYWKLKPKPKDPVPPNIQWGGTCKWYAGIIYPANPGAGGRWVNICKDGVCCTEGGPVVLLETNSTTGSRMS